MPCRPRFLALLCLACLPCLPACSAVHQTATSVVEAVDGPYGRADMDLAGTTTLFMDSKIYRGDIMVMVHPNINLEQPPAALFVPLGLTQEMRDASAVSQGVSRQVWQQFLSEGTFSTLEFAGMAPPYQPEMAVAYARQKGASMLVGGYITYYFDGGVTGDTKVSIQLEVYDTKTGEMLWSLAHAATLPYKYKRDYLLLEVKSRMPADPMAAVIAATASDMARLLHMWTEPRSFEKHNRAKRPFDSAFGKF